MAESVKFVSCVYSDGDVTGTAGFARGNSAAASVATTAAGDCGNSPRVPSALRLGSSTSRASAMCCTRRARSLCKQLAQELAGSAPASRTGNAFQSGSRSRMAAKVSAIVCPVKGAPPREHFVEDAAEGPDVGRACRPAGRAPARGSCRPLCRESRRRASRRSRPSATVKYPGWL